jgi:hypothetical protein
MSPSRERVALDSSDSISQLDAEMAELTLLLPACWLAALERAAADEGKTAAQLVRHLIRDYLIQ